MRGVIKQRTRHDCAICTIAIALDQPYELIMERALQADAFDATRGCRAEYRILESFGLEQMKDFRILHRGDILSPEFFRHFAWRRRSILAVPSLNTPGGFHSVYFDGRNVIDPCDLKIYTAWEELLPDEIILFDELREMRG